MGRFITPTNVSATRDRVLTSLVSAIKRKFQGVLVDKNCSVDAYINKSNPKIGYISLSHYDLMEYSQRYSDVTEMVQIATNNPKVESAQILGNLKDTISFKEFYHGAMPDVTIEVKIIP